MNANSSSPAKVSLPAFLKILTGCGSDMKKAMTIAGKVYKLHNTYNALAGLTDERLKELGLDADEDRKLMLSSLAKAGYTHKSSPPKKLVLALDTSERHSPNEKKPVSSLSKGHSKPITTPSRSAKRKRKQRLADDENEFLPSGPSEQGEIEGTWDFKEVLDEEELKNKSVVINRAPVMMAWSLLVAEKMHFSRSEALSIASVYTEMNAVSKGISLGKYKDSEARGREASKDGSQPYVELMDRRVPLFRNKDDQWRALSNGQPVTPNSAFDYITRSFRQQSPFVMGALRLLADSYSSTELNKKAWSLYADFRPEVNEWGKRSEMLCSRILSLRKKTAVTAVASSSGGSRDPPQREEEHKPSVGYGKLKQEDEEPKPASKKARTMTVEEYEAMLDSDTTFDHVDLDVH